MNNRSRHRTAKEARQWKLNTLASIATKGAAQAGHHLTTDPNQIRKALAGLEGSGVNAIYTAMTPGNKPIQHSATSRTLMKLNYFAPLQRRTPAK